MKASKQFYVLKGWNSFKKCSVYSKGGIQVTTNLMEAKLYATQSHANMALMRGASGMRPLRYVCIIPVLVNMDDGNTEGEQLKKIFEEQGEF